MFLPVRWLRRGSSLVWCLARLTVRHEIFIRHRRPFAEKRIRVSYRTIAALTANHAAHLAAIGPTRKTYQW